MLYVSGFDRLGKNDSSKAGGKGASLGEMTRAGFPIPPGYVILSDAFERFLQFNNIESDIEAILKKTNHENVEMIERASEEIQAIILRSRIPPEIQKSIMTDFKKLKCKYVAVRSSATAEDSSAAAWAGQLESYLNTTKENLAENVKKCWASLFTPRAIFYRFEKGLHNTHISVAVVVQRMIQSEVSGIAFSVHPITQDKNSILIESGWGLGEAVVSGQITPDNYVITKNYDIIEKNINEQSKKLVKSLHGNKWVSCTERGQKITDSQIKSLARIIIGIEMHYGFACDIEWALEKGKFYIVQSRPITTLGGDKDLISGQKEMSPSSDSKLSDGKDVVDKFLDIMGDDKILNFEADFINLIVTQDWMYYYDKNFGEGNIYPHMVIKIGNHINAYLSDTKYHDISRQAVLDSMRDPRFLKESKRRYDASKKEIDALYWSYWDGGNKNLLNMLRKATDLIREIVKITLRTENLDKKAYDMACKELKVKAPDKVWDVATLVDFMSFDTQVISQARSNTKGGKGMQYLFSNYVYMPTQKETDEKLKKIRKLDDNVLRKIAENKKTIATARLDAEQRKLFDYVHWALRTRDDRKLYLNKLQVLVYYITSDLFDSWNIDKEYVDVAMFFEVLKGKDFITSLLPVLKKRKKGMTLIYYGNGVYEQSFTSQEEDKHRMDGVLKEMHGREEIKGETGCKGITCGIVKIVNSHNEFNKFNEGEILVTTMTWPEYVPLMKKAAAIVTDQGGVTSHAAIVSRELNKPCIIGTKNATKVLKDGDLIEVDATRGIAKKIDSRLSENMGPSRFEDAKRLVRSVKQWFNQGGAGVPRLVYMGGAIMKLQDQITGGLGLHACAMSYSHEGDRTWWCMDHDDGIRIAGLLAKDKQKLRAIYGGSLDAEKNFYNYIKTMGPVEKIKDIAVCHNRLYGLYEWFFGHDMLLDLFVMWSDQEARIIKNKYPNLKEDIQKLVSPRKLTYGQREELDLLKIGQALRKNKIKNLSDLKRNPALYSMMERHKREFDWMEFNYKTTVPISIEQYLSRCFEMLKTKDDAAIKKKISEIESYEREHARLVKKICEQNKMSAQDKDILDTITFTCSWQDDRKRTALIGAYYMNELTRVAAERYDVDFLSLQFLYPSEFENIVAKLQDGEKVSVPAVQDSFCVWYPNGTWAKFYGEEMHELRGIVFKIPDFKGVDEISGTCASQGKVKGNVRIVHNVRSSNFEKGEILVTSMTRPEFVPLMKKASAIITDEGGITSHAAIVSRELKIPCIVGTKWATEFFKDGDSVEVDAIKGIVRKISSDMRPDNRQPPSIDDDKKSIMQKMITKINSTNWYRQGGEIVPFFLFIPYRSGNIEWGDGTIFVVQDGMDNKGYFDSNIEKIKAQEALDAYFKDKDLIKKRIIEWKKRVEVQKKLFDKILDANPSADIRPEISEFIEANKNAWVITIMIENFDPWGEYFMNKYAGRLSNDELAILTGPKKLSYLQEELIDWHNILKRKNIGGIRGHLEKYYWYQTSWQHAKMLDEKYFKSKYAKDIKHVAEIRQEVNNTLKHFKQMQKSREEMLRKKNINKESRMVFEFFSELNDWRDERKKLLTCRMNYLLSMLLDKIVKINGISRELADQIYLPDLSSLKLTQKQIDLLEMKTKTPYVMWVSDKGREEWLFGDDAIKIKSELENAITKDTRSASGRSAYPGKITGQVRIVNSLKEANDILQGEILVSVMTRPELVPAMKKAAAIITDEGGITCHAAIISRELKIPCIVGTQVATHILKTGDLVEVDATRGVVNRIMSDNKKNAENGVVSVSKYFEKFLSKIPRQNITRQEGSFSSLIFTSFFEACFAPLVYTYFPFDFGSFIFFSKGDAGIIFYDQKKYFECTRFGYDLFKRERKFSHYENYKALSKKINALYKRGHPKVLKKMSDEGLLAAAKDIIAHINQLLLCTLFSEALDHEVLKELYDAEKGTDYDTFSQIASLNTTESFETRRIKILAHLKSGYDPYDYQWMLLDYHDAGRLEDVAKAVKKDKRDIERVKELKKEITINKKKVLAYRKTLNPVHRKLLDFSQLCIYLRDARKVSLQKSMTMFANIIRHFLARKGIDESLAVYVISCYDLNNGILNRPDLREILETRSKGVFLYQESGAITILNYDYNNLLSLSSMLTDTENKSEIKGATGCPGTARGKVRVILSKSDFAKFLDGDILVTSMTRPEFVPLMKKAIAVITDEGGVTCHAAIVSRELKIPCVIGTRNATRWLKNGDEVEVDATNGIVRIIKNDVVPKKIKRGDKS